MFDVNETLIDIESLNPYFARVFGDSGVLREWFGQLVTYSMTVTLAECYADFFSLGQSVLRMIAEYRDVELTDEDVLALADAMASMPPHPDVPAVPRHWSGPAWATTSRASSVSTHCVCSNPRRRSIGMRRSTRAWLRRRA